MLLTLIIALVVTLVVIAIIVNAIQQHKERLATLRRAEFSKFRTILEDTEELIVNAANVPLSPAISQMLLKRIAFTLKAMVELEPAARDIKQRLQETEKRLSDSNADSSSFSESVALPESDQQLIGMIKGIKKIRAVLRSEHARGNVDTQMVIQEDKRLEVLQLKINVESQIKRGNQARGNNMLGSARQYYEKAMTALTNTPHQDEYATTRKAEVIQALQDIAIQLKEGNVRDREKKEGKENKDLDELFAPKRKW
jgi:hypothetical protein